jgi:hypothetical protein
MILFRSMILFHIMGLRKSLDQRKSAGSFERWWPLLIRLDPRKSAVSFLSDHPITRSPDHGDHPILAPLCLRPSARAPPGIYVLLQTQHKPDFDRAMTARSKPFFLYFLPSLLLFATRKS